MKYEYYQSKSDSNRIKHGIDFEDAKRLWAVSHVISQAQCKQGEERLMIIGRIFSRFYSCFFTVRESNIRIISCRRSRKKEVENYHETRQNNNS